ncbi:MAG: sensor histidine kinase [Bacteroidales bacterium]|nr:sensor histidine kinase [Bacteroidales bacterium]
MFRLIALIISIVLQLIAVTIALRLTKVTKYKISWILISIGFVFMAVRRAIDLFQFMQKIPIDDLNMINDWIAVVISILISIGVIIIPEIFNYIKKEEHTRKIAEKKVLNAVLRTEEKERKRFANDLHDGLGPLLSTVKISLSALVKSENDNSKLEIIKNAEKVIEEAIKSIKEISTNISPHVLNNFGLASAIKNFTAKIKESKIINIDFQSNMFGLRLENNVEIVVFRSICELVNNTVKHANASLININLNIKNDIIDILYDDDGAGCNIEDILEEQTDGMGLQNMLSRISSINGYLEMDSEKGKGFHAYISINTSKIYDKT